MSFQQAPLVIHSQNFFYIPYTVTVIHASLSTAKQGDNAVGSVRPSVCLSVCPYQSKIFVCVCKSSFPINPTSSVICTPFAGGLTSTSSCIFSWREDRFCLVKATTPGQKGISAHSHTMLFHCHINYLPAVLQSQSPCVH